MLSSTSRTKQQQQTNKQKLQQQKHVSGRPGHLTLSLPMHHVVPPVQHSSKMLILRTVLPAGIQAGLHKTDRWEALDFCRGHPMVS